MAEKVLYRNNVTKRQVSVTWFLKLLSKKKKKFVQMMLDIILDLPTPFLCLYFQFSRNPTLYTEMFGSIFSSKRLGFLSYCVVHVMVNFSFDITITVLLRIFDLFDDVAFCSTKMAKPKCPFEEWGNVLWRLLVAVIFLLYFSFLYVFAKLNLNLVLEIWPLYVFYINNFSEG